MKILQISKLFYPHIGGVEQVVYDLCSELGTKVDMNVLAANTKFKYEKLEMLYSIIHKIPSFGILLSMPIAPTFPFKLRGLKSDILHFHFPFPIGEISYLLARPKGKVIVSYHFDIIKQKNVLKFYKPFLLRFLNKADVIVATSPNMIEHSEILQSFKNKCRFIPLGIDPKRFELNNTISKKVEELKGSVQKQILFFMGRLVYYKGIRYLIDAMKDIDAFLIIGGTGYLEEELKQQVIDNHLQDKIRFEGYITDDDLPAYYHACDLFVLPSSENTEAFGIVQLEAQICRKPVVSTNLPTGVPYANLNDVTGLTVPPKDSTALSNAINQLLKDDTLRSRLGDQARERVLDNFTTYKMGERYLELYKELLK